MLGIKLQFLWKGSAAKKLLSTVPCGAWCTVGPNQHTHTKMLSESCVLPVAALSHLNPFLYPFFLLLKFSLSSYYLSCSFHHSCPLAFLSMTFLFFFSSFFLPQSHSFNSQEHLHCNTFAVSHTPRKGVQLVHYVSWVFLSLMENTQMP